MGSENLLAVKAPTSLVKPPAPWPHFEQDEIEAVTQVLQSGQVNYWTGNEGRLFEREYADFVGCSHAIALANGTVSLELALHALGIGEGDEVIVPPRTYVATATAVAVRGALPVFADVDRDSGNLTAETVEKVISQRTRAVLCVHLGGWPCSLQSLTELCQDRGLALIEDCAQAHGARYNGQPVGSFGAFGSFSFCQDKILTTGGEGGLVTTSDTELFKRAWSYKDHGKGYDAVFHREHPPGFRWLIESFGTNWRLTEMQAAIGRVILKKLPHWVETRRAHARTYTERLHDLEAVRLPTPGPEFYHSYYKFYLYLRPDRLRSGWDRDRVQEAINQCGVPCFAGSCSEIYLEKAFPDSMRPSEPFPVARELGQTSLMFLVHPTLSQEWVEAAADRVREVITQATL